MVKHALSMLLCLLPAADPAALSHDAPRQLGTLGHPLLKECSGLAAGRANPDLLWCHNDSGGGERLFALDSSGKSRGLYLLAGARNLDWEDIACARINEIDFLLVGDIGDNNQTKSTHTIYFVPEPKVPPAAESSQRAQPLTPAMSLGFQYAEGAQNCEAMAYDPSSNSILLVTKNVFGSASVYRLPLPTDFSRAAQATPELIGRVWINSVTAMDVSPDGKRMMLGTYGPAYEFSRRDDETWAQALTRQPRKIYLPRRVQGEALCYGPDGRSIFVTSEGADAPIWIVPAKP